MNPYRPRLLPRRALPSAPRRPSPPPCLRCVVLSLRLSHSKPSDRPPKDPDSHPQPHPSEPPSSSTNPSPAERFSHLMDTLQSRALTASRTLNSLTGYTPIEAIKSTNAELEARLQALQSRVRSARAAYKTLTARRSSSQREVTTLLARQSSWTPAELERFTELYRQDHTLEAQVGAAAEELTSAEDEEQRVSAGLMQGILKRYHEEQVWSDRIRRASTWGTWGLMGVNILLFMVVQFVAEPWRRRRLVRGVAEEEKAVLDEVRARLDEVTLLLGRREVEEDVDEVFVEEEVVRGGERDEGRRGGGGGVALWGEAARDPRRWLSDLGSERRLDLRMRDASLLALEGVAAGVALGVGCGVAVMMLWR